MSEMEIGQHVQIRVTVAVPAQEADLRRIIDDVNRESGMDDSGVTYESFCEVGRTEPGEPDFDADEFALWILDNRDISEVANHLISHFITEGI